MPSEPPAQALTALQPLVALGFGVLVGLLTQLVASRLRYNGGWDAVPIGRRAAMSATGALAAFVVGLWVLDHPNPDATTPYVYRLWLWQTIAAWAGSLILDTLAQLLNRALGSSRD